MWTFAVTTADTCGPNQRTAVLNIDQSRKPMKHSSPSIHATSEDARRCPLVEIKTTLNVCLTLLVAILATSAAHAAITIQLSVDATDVSHGIQHAHLLIPVRPGPLTLAYPKWIPGEHGPNGPITQLMNLHFVASGRELRWHRGAVDGFSFHVTLPSGVRFLDVYLDYFSPPQQFGPGFGDTPNSTPYLLILLFNQVMLYPSQLAAANVEVGTEVTLPQDWAFDCALTARRMGKGKISLATAPLSTLVDSPLLAGRFFRQIEISDEPLATSLSIAADDPADLTISDRIVENLRKLVSESRAVFGVGHYHHYVWLLSLGDSLDHDGTEHSESSDIREGEKLFTDPVYQIEWRLFPHEYIHSWNGKYRRPIGLATPNFQKPMIDNLLWMYEGLTRYYGDLVLSARSGLATSEQSRDYLAYVAAQMAEDRPGRSWRPLEDTATAVPTYANAPLAWSSIRRGPDYYNEMLLIWLEADMAIRESTQNRKSLDDFCRKFFAGPDRAPIVRPYSRADVLTALDAVVPLNWDRFFVKRIDNIHPQGPLQGLNASGWRLTFDRTPNHFLEDVERISSSYNLSFSLGVWVAPDGTVQDVVTGSPAFDAGVAPGMRLVSIANRKWTIEASQDAITAAEHSSAPIELEVRRDDKNSHTLQVSYHQGLRYPHLSRDPSYPDMLSKILAPVALTIASGIRTAYLEESIGDAR